MQQSTSSNRRAFVKWMGALPLLGYITTQGLFEKTLGAVKRNRYDNIYTRIGVKPIINARGPWTYISGTLELPEVKAAKQQAAEYFVNIWELHRAVGRRLAELSGAEAGLVTSGAAGAMAVATAACIAGTDPAKIWQLPDSAGLKNEVIMLGGRSLFDSAIRGAGGKLVLAYTHDELERAITEKTAMVYTMAEGERLEKALSITKKAKVPMLVDWADRVPPMENFYLPGKMGVDLYTFSGGKGLCGPQCTGLLLGRKDLIEAALANSSPWEGAVCRPMKVGKEEIMGLLAAVEAWTKMNLQGLDRQWDKQIRRIAQVVETVPGVTTETRTAYAGPSLIVRWDEAAFKLTVAECAKKLLDGEPPIEVATRRNPSAVPGAREGDPKVPESPEPDRIQIISATLQPGEELLIARRLREVPREAQKAA
jgi:L-seryl-tRNA(Ser) seleniumtransferase